MAANLICRGLRSSGAHLYRRLVVWNTGAFPPDAPYGDPPRHFGEGRGYD